MKITFLASQYARISGGNRALFEYANRLKKMGHSVRWFVLAKPARWYRLDHWPRFLNKNVSVLSPNVIDWLDNQIPIEILSINDASLIPDSDILLASILPIEEDENTKMSSFWPILRAKTLL